MAPQDLFEGRRSEEGFALVAALWLSALLALAAFVVTSGALSHVRTVESANASAEAEAAADAGVNLAIAELIDLRSQRGADEPSASFTRACAIGDAASLAIDVRDEAGRIDLNLADDDLLRTLMLGLGWPRPVAEMRLERLRDYADEDDDRSPEGAEAPEYRAAGRPPPSNRAFDAASELGAVLGFDEQAVDEMAPFVTVHSGQPGLEPTAVRRELAAVLQRGLRAGSLAGGGVTFDEAVPQQFLAAADGSVYAVRSEAVSARGARFVREAVVSIGATAPRNDGFGVARASARRPAPYRIVDWRRAASAPSAIAPGGALPPC